MFPFYPTLALAEIKIGTCIKSSSVPKTTGKIFSQATSFSCLFVCLLAFRPSVFLSRKFIMGFVHVTHLLLESLSMTFTADGKRYL